MSKTTIRDPRHPWNYFKAMEEKMKKILTTKSTENLDVLLKQIGKPTEAPRHEKIDTLMERWSEVYYDEFLRMHGYPLEDTKDHKKFRKHFRRFKRRTQWQIFVYRMTLLPSILINLIKKPFMKKDYTHQELLGILDDLDNCDIEVSEWAARFIESNLDARSFTRKQKEIILKLKDKYL
jgi:Ca2+-binding EF-hand superfamily protein